jgi:RNA polymerase sigma-70 factor, ECF subfamily
MNEQERHNLFSELIARHQSQLYGYIFAVVRNWEDADDVFQTVCLVLWSKFEVFRPGSNFFAWARQTAKLTVTKFLRQKQLATYVSEELLDNLTETVVKVRSDGGEFYLTALEQCRDKLNSADEELLELHYVEGLSSHEMAERIERSQPSVCNSLNRIRDWLLECIQMELARQEHSAREYR